MARSEGGRRHPGPVEDDRFEIAEARFGSIYRDKLPPFDDALLAPIQRRCDGLDPGTVIGIPWEDVKRRAREVAGRRPGEFAGKIRPDGVS